MAIRIKNGSKQFGNDPPILNNFNMQVNRGTIYGLFGASGCGKTTLLACIVGFRTLDSGEISIFGRTGKSGGALGRNCGYMPQEPSLVDALTIQEVLQYFGMLYGMDDESIKMQTQFLTKFLEMPPITMKIQDLSGGQKQRVSLSAAMIHNPPLLILDEPTVGLDPLLRQRIWEHLFQISRENGTTIIISTHYIDEMKRCDKVGFMRGGRLLLEDDPQILLSEEKSDSLEDIVLQYCKKDEGNDAIFSSCHVDNDHTNPEIKLKSFRRLSTKSQDSGKIFPVSNSNTKLFNHSRIISALTMKSWHRQRRDYRLYTAQILLPFILTFLCNNIVGLEPRTLKVAIVSDLPIEKGTTIIEYCQKNPNYNPLQLEDRCLKNVGVCDFVTQFKNNEFQWITKNSYTEAYQSIQMGETTGLINFPTNYSDHLRNRMVHKMSADTMSLEGSTISTALDFTNALISFWFRKTSLERYQSYAEDIVTACSGNPGMARPAFVLNPIYGKGEFDGFLPFFQPGFLVFAFLLQNTAGFVWVVDRSQKLEDRDFVAGVRMKHRIVSDFIINFVILCVQTVIFLGILVGVYEMTNDGSWFLAIALTLLVAVSGLSFGWMIGAVIDDIIQIMFLLIFLTVIHAMSSGMLWPLECIPATYRTLCNLLPVTKPIEALRSICFRGWGLSHPRVAAGFINSFAWILVCLLVCFAMERRRNKQR